MRPDPRKVDGQGQPGNKRGEHHGRRLPAVNRHGASELTDKQDIGRKKGGIQVRHMNPVPDSPIEYERRKRAGTVQSNRRVHQSVVARGLIEEQGNG